MIVYNTHVINEQVCVCMLIICEFISNSKALDSERHTGTAQWVQKCFPAYPQQ